MFKYKFSVLAGLLVGPAVWALASILSNTNVKPVGFATSAQVNTYELMSNSKDLPVQSYESY